MNNLKETRRKKVFFGFLASLPCFPFLGGCTTFPGLSRAFLPECNHSKLSKKITLFFIHFSFFTGLKFMQYARQVCLKVSCDPVSYYTWIHQCFLAVASDQIRIK